jgi:methionyl-tRNA formyltransferase
VTKKNIVLLGRRDRPTAILYNSLRAEFLVAKVIVEEGEPKLKFLKRRIKRLGLARVAGQVAFRTMVVPWLESTSRRRVLEIVQQFALDPSPIPPMELIGVKSVNSKECIEALGVLQPDVIVVSGTRIISGKVLACVPAVFINIHAGITPLYRGSHGAYWALVERDRGSCGVTVHQVDTGVDTGPILGQAQITPNQGDNFVTYGLLQQAAGLPLLKKAIRDVCEHRLAPVMASSGTSRLWTHPTLSEYIYHRLKSGVK